MERNTTNLSFSAEATKAEAFSPNQEAERPMWHQPSISLLEVETTTLTGNTTPSTEGITFSS